MTQAEHDVVGPVDFIILEGKADNMKGEAADALLDLVERGIVKIYDLLVVKKEDDGTFTGLNLEELDADGLGGFEAFAGAQSGLLGDEDLAQAAEAIAPGTVAVLIVFENSWARPFVAAARRAEFELVASARIPADALNAALDALD